MATETIVIVPSSFIQAPNRIEMWDANTDGATTKYIQYEAVMKRRRGKRMDRLCDMLIQHTNAVTNGATNRTNHEILHTARQPAAASHDGLGSTDHEQGHGAQTQ